MKEHPKLVPRINQDTHPRLLEWPKNPSYPIPAPPLAQPQQPAWESVTLPGDPQPPNQPMVTRFTGILSILWKMRLVATIFSIWFGYRFSRIIMSTFNQVNEWAHAHPATSFLVATFRLNSLMTILTAQDLTILLVLLAVTCYLLPIPRIIWELVHILVV